MLLLTIFTTFFINVFSRLDIYNETVRFNIALKQRNLDILETTLLDVSNPDSNNYGKYWDYKDIRNLVSPLETDVLPLLNWLDSYNVKYNHYGDSLECFCHYSLANSLFDVVIQYDEQEQRYVVLSDNYLVPYQFNHIIEFIEGFSSNNYFDSHYLRFNDGNESFYYADEGYAGREVLNSLYNITHATVTNDVSVCSVEYQGNLGFIQTDLNLLQKYNNETECNVSKNHIVGSNEPYDTESELDVQLMGQTAENVDLWYWVDPLWLYSFATKFSNTKTVPDVISMSWGWSERQQCTIAQCTNQTSEQYIKRVNTEYMKIGLRGVTITVSSGDAGAPGRTNEDCGSEDPDPNIQKVNPVFPGSSPYVTSVGGTFIVEDNSTRNWDTYLCKNFGCATGHSEEPTNYNYTHWTTGGGFAVFGSENLPSWQYDAVNKYLNSSVPLPSDFNRNGRGYPDVSAIGHNCPIIQNNSLIGVDGTSCSSPVFAAIVSLLNDHQVSKGKSKLGYINPLLYKMYGDDPSIFNDIVAGNNYCTEYSCCDKRKDDGSDYGYLSAEGWDPVTGLGTPNVGKMIEWLDKRT